MSLNRAIGSLAGLTLILLAAPTVLGQGEPWTAWHNSLAPQGPATEELTLAAGGSTNYRIVRPAAATSQDVKAAADLQTWLEQMTGVRLSIVSEGTPLGSDLPISIGRTSLLAQSGLPAAAADLGDEGYGIAVQNGKLFLWGGRTRGAIHAVYALLEEDLGCRWYSPTHSRIPSRPVLTFSPVPRTVTPPLPLRDPFYYVAFGENWSLRNRTNAPWAPVRESWGGRIDYDGMFVHTFGILLPASQYYAAHPEYYMQNASGQRVTDQLCNTNQEVRQIIAQKVRQTLAANPYTEIIDVSKNDNKGRCLCSNCKPLDDAEGSGMGSLLPLVNYVADQIAVEYPNVKISTLAYFDTEAAPLTVRPRSNVIIRLCNTVSWSLPFTPMENSEFGTKLQDWAAIHDQMSIWDYTVNYYHYLAPMPNMDLIARDIAFMRDHHVVGIMTQGAYQGTGERDTMRSWIIARLLWDPDRDWYELQQDFIWGHFGNAAPAIGEYNELLYNQGILYAKSLRHPPFGIRFSMDHEFLSPDFLSAASAIFDTAEALAENSEVRDRVQRERLPILYVRLEQGPHLFGAGYDDVIDQFETIARREGVTHTREGSPNLDARLAEYRDRWDVYLHEPIGPTPADKSTGVWPGTQLSWSVRQEQGTVYDLYLGTSNPPPFHARLAEPSFDPGGLLPWTTWYWRVDAIHDGETFAGPTWRLTTRRYPDFDADGDVDQSDFGHMQACLSGWAVPLTNPACQGADFDTDSDVDRYDLQAVLDCISGTGNPADPACIP